MIFLRVLALISGFTILACSTISLNQKIELSPSDWTMAGGSPQQQNVSTSVLEPPLNMLWRYNCDAGVGYSAISAADAIVFTNTLQGEMICLDITTGGKLGQISFLGKEANTTPLINDNKIINAYAGDNKYSLCSYNLLVGEINWRANFGFIETSPVVYENYIYVGSLDGKSYKIDKSNGKEIWSFDAGTAIHSTCAITKNRIVFGTDDGHIYCLNAGDGLLAWKYKTDNSVFSTPLIFENKIYIGSYDSNYYCISLDSGNVSWKQDLSTKVFTGSALYKNFLIFGGVDGNLYCLNAKDGLQLWKYQTKGVIVSTPMVSGENVYFTSYDWYLYCLNCIDGKLKWSYQLDGKPRTSPVIWGDYLFTASDFYLYCFTPQKNIIK
jgi:outer membrane protein assembly factor BamB